MNNAKRRDMFEAALKPKTNPNPRKKEETKPNEVSVLQQQQPHKMEDLPEVKDFVHSEDL